MPRDIFDDEELGFIGAIGSAAGKLLGGIGKGIKKAVQKKKAKAKPKTIQMPVTNIEGTVPTAQQAALKEVVQSAVKAKENTGTADPQSIVRELVAAIPPLVRAEVLEALKASRDSAANQAQTLGTITEQVDAALQPRIAAMLAALQTQQVSRQATYEHEELVKRADFERSTKSGLESILSRLDALDQTMALRLKNPKLAVVTQKLPIFGPKSVLES